MLWKLWRFLLHTAWLTLGIEFWGFIVVGSLTMQSSEVTFEYSVKYKYVHYI
ncbi:hypothetical protein ANAPC1_01065 [Anaplasma phagocytophilum]|uniref:Uncharacterized protein n=1 Tax=Anaplasma phagocytophilum TaxID=948 RepID=A0AA45UTW9_ANAPH|nr:hypothetical protein ANAPC1_01059 [Anaplasma phagocytophilum]SBO14702.1 hypothetical protein ANAPC1_01065 [Anaplasma phagocytophilum]SBO33759.1 hypothetical protein ANAPC2_01450 [Anaplasma phagocytophilum]SBO33997.1 hypothetical protein ANAPC4_01435 [Anaplasma phagocytophilum]